MILKQHNHISTLTIQLLEQTNKGWKVLETNTAGLTKKEREGKIAYYSQSDIKTLFTIKNV